VLQGSLWVAQTGVHMMPSLALDCREGSATVGLEELLSGIIAQFVRLDR
jgi:hypothetical protein